MAFDSALPLFLHLPLLFFNVKLQQTAPRSRAFGPPVFSLCCCWIKAFLWFYCVLRMLLEKSSGERLCFSVTVSELAVTLQYSQPGSSIPLAVSFRTEGRISPQRWTHLALQVTHLLASRSPTGARLHCQTWRRRPSRAARDQMSVRKMLRNHAMTFDLLIDWPTDTAEGVLLFLTDTVVIQEIHSFIFIQFLCAHIFHQICFFLCLWFSVPLSSPSLF